MRSVAAFIGAIMGAVAVASSWNGAVAAEPSRLDQVIAAGKLKICTAGDYKPFTYYKEDGSFEGIDIDFGKALAKSLNVEPVFVKTTWANLMADFLEKCDVAMGGVSVTLDRQRKASFSVSHMVDGKAPIVRCADLGRFPNFAAIDQPGVRAIVNPGGTNERFARANYKQASLMLHPDNVTIFQQIIENKADVMVTDTSETLWQAKQHPELCPVPMEKPLQYAEKAYMLPRADVAFKEYVDTWMHLLKMTGGYDQIVNSWLK